MQLDRLFVFALSPVKKPRPEPAGGEVEITEEVRGIFESSFLGVEKSKQKKQPFHFNFGGTIRKNEIRDSVVALLEVSNKGVEEIGFGLARRLGTRIDERVGGILFSIGLGWESDKKKCVFWAFPSDRPIQVDADHGKPKISEIKHAFTQKSAYRKAAFFTGPQSVSRDDFLSGEVIDSTRQGSARSVAQYWVEEFLCGQIGLTSERGLSRMARALKIAGEKATSHEEIVSVAGAYDRLLSGSLRTMTLNMFAQHLVGDPRVEYLRNIPKNHEADAVFSVTVEAVRRYISNRVFILEGGIQVLFPVSDTIDPTDFVKKVDGKDVLRLELPIVGTSYGK